jgi:hypothetical protein
MKEKFWKRLKSTKFLNFFWHFVKRNNWTNLRNENQFWKVKVKIYSENILKANFFGENGTL